ncbi:MAG: helix-turn-helix domain-containing protein [Nitrospirota bacterium]
MNGQTQTPAANSGHHTENGMPEYLTGEQVAELLQVSVKSVWRWVKTDPSLPCFKIGRTIRFPRERLMRWLRAREQGSGRSKQPEPLLHSASQHTETIEQSLTVSGPCAHS